MSMDKGAETVPDDFADFDATLSLSDPIQDYNKLMNEKVKVDAFVPTEMMYLIWDKVSAGAREAIWKLLFDFPKAELEKAAILLKTHRDDACYYSPSDYNDWIIEVRNELLKRGMLEFWQNEIVTNELGPAWARDSDLYDDMDDPAPANFYKFGGCVAPWLKANDEQQQVELPTNAESKVSTKAVLALKNLTKETPLDDYKFNMALQANTDPDDKKAYKKIFGQVRDLIWELLFCDSLLSLDNIQKVSALLEEYKRDACLYSPYDYNEWITKVRDELFKRKHFDFWQNVIVNKQLGLCWAKDSDYFDDMEDPKPLQFYESGTDLMKQEDKQ